MNISSIAAYSDLLIEECEREEKNLTLAVFRYLHPEYIHKVISISTTESDLFLPVARGTHHGLWIVFKASDPHTSTLTSVQQKRIKSLIQEGYCAIYTVGLLDTLISIEKYLKLGRGESFENKQIKKIYEQLRPKILSALEKERIKLLLSKDQQKNNNTTQGCFS